MGETRSLLLGVVLLGLLGACPAVWSQDRMADLAAANSLYQKGDYVGARRQYEAWVQRHGPAAGVLYNLGNTCYQQRQVGWALLYYERALLTTPRDSDLRANRATALASRRTATSTEVPGWGEALTRELLERLTLNELAVAAALAALAAMAWALLWLRSGALRRRSRWLLAGLVALTLALGGLAVGKARLYHDPARVVVVADTALLSGPAASFPQVRRAYQGEVAHLRRRQGMWSEVRLEGGTVGWLDQDTVVAPSTGP